jgi:hypothetical protein
MTDACKLSAEEWAHELHYMAKAGFDDLYHASIGVSREGQPIADLKTTITTGFSLVTSGLEVQPDALAPNLVEFLAAAEVVDIQKRAELMRRALGNLSEAVGFDIGP